MPKAGQFEYPVRTLDDCVDAIKRAFEEAKTQVFTRETFGAALKMSAKGGGFGQLVGSIGMYGLADTADGVRYLDLAELILHGEQSEKNQAMEKAVRKVRLFADVYDRFGESVTEDKIRLFLREKANVEIGKAGSVAVEVGKLLKSNMQYLRPAKAGEKTEPSREPLAGGKTLVESGVWELLTDSYGALRVVDDLSADFAINALKKFKERFAIPSGSQIGLTVVEKSDTK